MYPSYFIQWIHCIIRCTHPSLWWIHRSLWCIHQSVWVYDVSIVSNIMENTLCSIQNELMWKKNLYYETNGIFRTLYMNFLLIRCKKIRLGLVCCLNFFLRRLVSCLTIRLLQYFQCQTCQGCINHDVVVSLCSELLMRLSYL